MSERFNNRKNDELRPIKFTKDYTKHALSSVLVEFGDTKVIVTASVDDKAPKWMEKDDPRGWITAEYSLLPTSTHTRCQRERTKISGRTQEIQRLIGRSLCVGAIAAEPRWWQCGKPRLTMSFSAQTCRCLPGY